MYCFNTNRPVLRVLKLTPRQGTPMRVHKRPPEICLDIERRVIYCNIIVTLTINRIVIIIIIIINRIATITINRIATITINIQAVVGVPS